MQTIRDFPDYCVSQEGHVFSNKNGRRRKLKLYPFQPDGYLHAILYRGGKKHAMAVHRLVADAFLGPRPDGMVTRHLDGDMLNNHVSNLGYATQKANIHDKWRHGTMARGERTAAAKLSKGDVEWIRAYPKRRGMFAEMSRRLQISINSVCKAYHGKTWAHL